MSDPTRADLRVEYLNDRTDSYTAPPYKAHRRVTDAELEAMGYVPKAWFDACAEESRQRYARIQEWERFGVKAWEPCPTCGGWQEIPNDPYYPKPCPDCVDGRVLAEPLETLADLIGDEMKFGPEQTHEQARKLIWEWLEAPNE